MVYQSTVVRQTSSRQISGGVPLERLGGALAYFFDAPIESCPFAIKSALKKFLEAFGAIFRWSSCGVCSRAIGVNPHGSHQFLMTHYPS
jgi:hypothetical protein